jgi:uncharacterized repeat protein (TIGR01451 family)
MKCSGCIISTRSVSQSFRISAATNFKRRFRIVASCIAGLLLAGVGFHSQGAQLIAHAVPAAVQGLTPIDRVAGDQQLNLAIALPLRNRDALETLLRRIYDPASPSYHHYLTPEQFAEQFGPSEADYEALLAFARSNRLSITATSPNRVLLDVSGSAADIEAALHVALWNFQHPVESRSFYAPSSDPSLDLTVPILGIGGLNNFALPRPRHVVRQLAKGAWAQPNAGSGPSGTYMGFDFRSAYVPGSVLNGSGQSVGLLQFDGYTASDITYYEAQAGLPAVTLTNVLLDGFSGLPTGGGGEVEVSLDIQMAISMAPGLSKVIVYEAGPSGSWYDILNRMATDNLAKQLSCSWYIPGGGADPVADQIFLQIAAQGQSFFNASGDADAYPGAIDFPGETPYITQVGGTTLTTSGPAGPWVSETVWNWGNGVGSGGGIGTYYPIPSWQTNVDMTASQGSATMRNTPDVALTADNVYVRANAADHNVGGTSCAAPLWAGFAALINQQAAATGKQPIGFINPIVYALGGQTNYTSAFHDITTGNNTSSRSPSRFYAVPGYDLCTGWGTPAGQPLIDALEPLVFVLLPASATEGSGLLAGAGQVQLPSTPATNVTVQLTSSDPAQVQVPATVTILAGQTNANFDLTLLDDGLLKGTQTATITALVPGYGSGLGTMQIYDEEVATLAVSLPATATEGQSPLQGQVQISAPPAANVAVGLSSSSPQDLQVPATVIIPAGQTTAPFTALAVTNNKLEAPQLVTVTAHVQNWTDGSAGVLVYNTNQWTLTLSLPASTWENIGVLTNAGRIALSGVVASDVSISLVSDNSSKLIVPSAITVPAGATSSSFDLTLVDNAIADGHQTVTVTASAPNFTNGSAPIYIMDDESPPPPSNPQPGNLVTGVPANTNLSWSSGFNSELVTNGDFESGTLSNWTVVPSTYGRFVINTGTNNPPSPDGPLPPFAGSFDALGQETGPGVFSMYQDVDVPAVATPATLSWAHRVRNFYTSYTTSQAFQVRICSTNNAVLATAFTTSPGDPLLGDWVQKSYDMSSFAGQRVRIQFWVSPASYYLDAHVDNVSLQVNSNPGMVTNDVYFGTDPAPGPANFQGSTTNNSWTLPLLAPQTTYYWQIVSHKGGVAAGPIWRFTTKGADHFAWDPVFSPQVVNQPFAVTVSARDSFNRTVTNFTGSVALRGQLGAGIGNAIEDFESGIWPHSPWVLRNPSTPGTLGIAYAHDGNYGLQDPDWMYRTDVSEGEPNDAISCWVRPNAATAGRAYFGFGASSTGCWSFVAAPNTSQLLIQLNSGYGFANVAAVAQTFQSNKWYKLSVQWTSAAAITGTLFDSDGTTVLNTLSYTNTTGPMSGGVALRSFGFSLDTVLSGSLAPGFPITPTNSGPFVDGSWTGNVTALALGTNVVLVADGGDKHIGLSNPFDVSVLNDLSLSLADAPDPVPVGVNLIYTLTVGNTGPNPATSVTLTNVLPPSVNFISAVASQGTCTNSGQWVTADLGDISGGSSALVTIVCSPNLAGITLSNWAIVSRGEADPYPQNDSASVATTVGPPAISVADASAFEGNAGTTTLLFPVTLSAPSAQTISVTYATTNGTALAGSDYVATTGALQFSPGTTNAHIAVTLLGDTVIEPDETFRVTLSNPVNSMLGRSQAVGTILNDDGLPGQLHHFACSPIASPQYIYTPWFVTITAQDYFNATISNFNGTVLLYATSSNPICGNADFETGTLDPWTPLNLGDAPGPYQLVSFDVNGDGTSSLAFGIAANSGTPDGITQNIQLFAGVPYTFDVDIAAYDGTGTDNLDGGTVELVIGTTTIAQYSFGPISNNQVLRNHLHATFVPPTSGTYPLSLTFSRTYLEANGLLNLVDDLQIVGPNLALALTPSVSGPFVNGTWSGAITAMSHATNVMLAADDGSGHIGTSNPFDVSSTNEPPVILTQPTNVTTVLGRPASFAVVVDGSLPLYFQWQLNHTNLLGATNAFYSLAQVHFEDAGIYTFTATNAFGSALSSNAVLTVLPVAPCSPTPPGLVGWWAAENNALDSAGANNGILLGGVTFAPGEVGQAFKFTGSPQAVDIPASAAINVGAGGGFTFEAWINPTTLDPQPVAEWNANTGDSGIGSHLWISGGSSGPGPAGNLYVNLVDTSGVGHFVYSGGGIVRSNAWQHVAWTYDNASGYVVLYCNGASVANAYVGSLTPQTSFDFYLGRRPNGFYSGSYYAGGIDEASLYQRALSPSEILALFEAGSYGKCPAGPCVPEPTGLVSWWQAESNALDSAGTNPGIPSSVSFANGRVGRAFSFITNDACVRMPASASLDVGQGAGVTLEGWINPAGVGAEQTLAEWSAGTIQDLIGIHFAIGVPLPVGSGYGCLYVNFRDDSRVDHILCSTPNLIQSGVFQHVAATYDAASGWARLFLDGSVVTQKNLGLFTPQTSFDFYLGAGAAGTEYEYFGSLDEFSIYNRALSPSEVGQIAATGGKCEHPPVLLVPPARELLTIGCPASFSVLAVGPQPIGYQWWKDNLPLSGQTNSSLAIGSVQSGDLGVYRVVAFNSIGSVTSPPALLALDQLPVSQPDQIARFASGGVRINASVLTANDLDGDSDVLRVVTVSSNSAAGGMVRLDGNWIYYAPPYLSLATDYFTYTVSDGHCGGVTSGGGVTVVIKPDEPQPTSFGVEAKPGGAMELKFDGVPGFSYRILYCGDLANPAWQVLGSGTADNLGVVTLQDPTAANAPKRYYRAVWP